MGRLNLASRAISPGVMSGLEMKMTRLKLCYTQREMAIVLGVSHASIIKMEARDELRPIHTLAIRCLKYQADILPDASIDSVAPVEELRGGRRELLDWITSRGVVGSEEVSKSLNVTRSCAVKWLRDLTDRGYLVAQKLYADDNHGHLVMYKAGSDLC